MFLVVQNHHQTFTNNTQSFVDMATSLTSHPTHVKVQSKKQNTRTKKGERKGNSFRTHPNRGLLCLC